MATRTKSTRVDNAYDRLKAEILLSRMPPGFQAPEPEIAERLGMSRTPVREALIRLEAAGLVKLVPRRGAKVLALSLKDLCEIYDILIALEPAALAKLAGKPVDSEDLEELEQYISQMEQAESAVNLDAWVRAEELFYRKLLGMSGNRRLADYVASLLDQLHRGQNVLLRMNQAPIVPVQAHRDLLAAVLSGNAEAVADLARRQKSNAKMTLKAVFRGCGLTQI